ncbi:MAG: DUF4192 domain-containing protein [Mycobacterium sp.]|nr:DUF4192 domain-containing protein [Acidimicrobiales bacterium]
MTHHRIVFSLNRPGALIAALPAVLGFTPADSLVLASIENGQLGAVMRVDLCHALEGGLEQIAHILAAASPEGIIAVVVQADCADCSECNEDYRLLGLDLAGALDEQGIDLCALYVVDRVQAGGRWHCADGCGQHGMIDDPDVSPLAVEAVVDGRRLYSSRADLTQVIAAEDGSEALVDRIRAVADDSRPEQEADPDGHTRRGVLAAIDAAKRLEAGRQLSDAALAGLAHHLTDSAARDALYALAVGFHAARAEALWTLLARRLPKPWRLEALVLLAFSAYVRSDGPLAGIALAEALECEPAHRMARMLDEALLSGMRPAQIRELALSGYRVADRVGVELPPYQGSGRRAG